MTESTSADGDANRAHEDKRPSEERSGGRRLVTAALLLAMMVTAVEQLVVSPAMTTIIAALKGGIDVFPWVISAYLLAATVSTPIYGKLADLYGRKRVCWWD